MLVVILFHAMIIFAQDNVYNYDIRTAFGKYFGDDRTNDFLAENVKAEINEDSKEVVLTTKDDGLIKYKEKDESEFREFGSMEKDSEFKFVNGELVSAHFTVIRSICTESGCIPLKEPVEYKLGNYKYKIPSGSSVVFEKGKDGKKDSITIAQLDEKKVEAPEIIDEKKTEFSEVEYVANGESLTLPNDDLIKKSMTEDIKLFYDTEKGAFFMEGVAQISDLEIGTFDSKKTYLYFDGKVYDIGEPYISLNKENNRMTIGAPAGSESPSIKFLPGNKYGGINIEEKGNFIVWARGKGESIKNGEQYSEDSLITIEDRKAESKIPLITTKGGYNIIDGSMLIAWNKGLNGPITAQVKSISIKNTETGAPREIDFTKSTRVPIQIHSLNSEGKLLEYKDLKGNLKPMDFDLFVSNEGGIIPARGKDEVIFSKVSLHALNAIDRSKMRSLSQDKQLELLKKPIAEIRKSLGGVDPTKINQQQNVKDQKIRGPIDNFIKKLNPVYQSLFIKGMRVDGNRKIIGNTVEIYNPNNLIKKDSKVYVQISTPSCPHCIPVHNKMKRDYQNNKGITYVYINAESQNALARKFGYDGGGVPQTYIFQNGKKIPGDWR